MESSLSQLLLLASALAIGLLVGVERGWSNRKLADGKRVAGLRTYGLIGLLGGIAGLLSNYLGAMILAVVFAAIAALVIATYLANRSNKANISATSHVAMLVTFLLGALAGIDQVVVAAACGVVTTLLLRSKRFLHRLLLQLSQHELNAGLQLLMISLVLLPVLPDQGYGPWQALNPYEIWWMVVLIASISFIGYVLIRIVGTRRGILMTGLAGGLLSSTALTLQLARIARIQPSFQTRTASSDQQAAAHSSDHLIERSIEQQDELQRLCSMGILLACGMMFPRVVLVAGLIQPDLVAQLFLPLSVMTLIIFGCAALQLHHTNGHEIVDQVPLKNPLELIPALLFGLLLAAVALLGKATVEWVGESALWMLALASGIADVDAINLTLARMTDGDIMLQTASLGIILASGSNTLLKSALAVFAGGLPMVRTVMLPLVLATVSGLLTAWLL